MTLDVSQSDRAAEILLATLVRLHAMIDERHRLLNRYGGHVGMYRLLRLDLAALQELLNSFANVTNAAEAEDFIARLRKGA